MKVSVCIITYNHEPFIAEAIEGALMQKTDFPYEIIIGEDESQDGTREICIEYAERYPEKIRLFLRSRRDVIYIDGNPTGRFNFIESMKAARGEYIALCEGDDYWTDPYKLQKQLDFLGSNSSCTGVAHNTLVTDGAISSLMRLKSIDKKLYMIEDFLITARLPFQTASLLFRKECIENMPDVIYTAPSGDRVINFVLLKQGNIGYINETMSVYRKHAGGLNTRKRTASLLYSRFEMYKSLDYYLDHRFDFAFLYRETLVPAISKAIFEINKPVLESARRELLQLPISYRLRMQIMVKALSNFIAYFVRNTRRRFNRRLYRFRSRIVSSPD